MASIVFGASNGSWSDATKWVGGLKPTAADDAVFTATSANCTIDAGAVCRSLDCTGVGVSNYTGTMTFNGDLTVGDGTAGAGNRAIALVAGMTYTHTSGAITLVSTSATVQTVNFAGKTTSTVTFNASSNGSWQYTGAHTVITAGTVSLSKGTLDLNGQTVSWGLFQSNNTNVRTLTLGAANITLTGAGTAWNVGTATNLTMGANTAVITLSGAAAGVGHASTAGSVGYFYDVRFTGSGAQFLTVASTVTLVSVTRTGTAAKTDSFLFGATGTAMTVTNFTVNGNSVTNRVLVASNSIGSAKTITAATVTVTNADFRDITGAGAGSWDLSAITGNSGNCGGNTNITFTTPTTQTATGTASFTWSTHGWTSRVPLPQDTALIPNAFVAGRTVTMDMPRYGTIDFTGCTGTPAITVSIAAEFYGNITLVAALGAITCNSNTFYGAATQTFTSNGATWSSNAAATAIGRSKLTFVDAAVWGGACNTSGSGYIDTGSFNHSFYSLNLGNTSNVNLLGTSTISLTRTDAVTVAVMTEAIVSAASATFVISTASTNTRIFSLSGATIGTLTYTVAGSTGQLTIGNTSGTIGTINFSDASNARTLAVTSSTTLTVTNFNVQGTTGKLMTVNAVTGGTFFTLTKTSGVVSCNYLSIQDCHASGGARFYAGKNSVDVSGNSGWVFNSPPTSGSNLVMMGVG